MPPHNNALAIGAAGAAALAGAFIGNQEKKLENHVVSKIKQQLDGESRALLGVKEPFGKKGKSARVSASERPGAGQLGMKASSHPAFSSSTVTTGQPRIQSLDNGRAKRIQHHQLVSTLVSPGDTAFHTLVSTALQPGLTMGGFLANEAKNWEEYRINALRVYYVKTCADVDRGKIGLFADYDPNDAPPASFSEGSANMTSVSGAVNANMCIEYDARSMCDAQGPRKFVRTSEYFMGSRHDYDCGALFVCVEATNVSTALQIGDIWMEYDVSFFVPHLDSLQRTIFSKTAMFTQASDAAPVATGFARTAFPTPITIQNDIGVQSSSGGTFTLPNGLYLVSGAGTVSVAVTGNAQTRFSVGGTAITATYGAAPLEHYGYMINVGTNRAVAVMESVPWAPFLVRSVGSGNTLFVNLAPVNTTGELTLLSGAGGVAGATRICFTRIDA